jgi:class 3 adenylate cyclase/tetratricopeptide (TPR) repeat protein
MTCAHCGFEVASESRFCANCGAMLTGTPSAQLEGERRYLTVMFCDLVGSTDLSGKLDPEDFGELVLAYQEMGRAAVVQHGGLVAHYAGDGLLSFFGYPVAHEDDSDRAVLAALTILGSMAELNARAQELGDVTLQARVGIHNGPTVIGAMGSADRPDISLFGMTPNVAARLEAFAIPGTVVISENVSRVLRGRFHLVELGTPELKGVSEPLAVSRVDGAVTAATSRSQGGADSVIGRARESQALAQAFERTVDQGQQTVLISGEPGVGKSTLVRTLGNQLEGAEVQWVQMQCSELASASPWRPVIVGLRSLLEISDYDSSDVQLEKLLGGIDALGSAASEHLPYLADLLGIDVSGSSALDGLSSELRRARTLDALIEWALALAARTPLVLVTEDLHWADPSTLDLLSRLVNRRSERPVLCLCTSRLGVPEEWDEAEVTHIPLARLGKAQSRALAVSLSSKYKVPNDTLVRLADRGDGVPLFIEELIRSAAEAHAVSARPSAELPDTLQSVLAARLDRLGEARTTAQAASVIGREFPLELLTIVTQRDPEVLQGHLVRLVDAGIVSEHQGVDGLNYAFHHALIQDVAYETLLRRRRRELHALTARALADDFPAVADAAPELVAHHHQAAGVSLDAARWFGIAGRRSVERAALLEAIIHYETGISLLRESTRTTEADELLLSLLILCANAHMGTSGPGGAETLPLWEDAMELAERLGNHDELTSALNGAAVYRSDRGELDTTIELASRILEIGRATNSRVAALRGNLTLGMAYFFKGEGRQAMGHCELGLSLERKNDYFTITYGVGHDQGTMGRAMLSWSQWWLGLPDASLATANEGLDQALRLPSSLSQAMARHTVALAHHLRNESEEATATARANVTLTEELNLPFWLGLSLVVLGSQRARRGDEGGLDDLDRALAILLDIGNRAGGSMGMAVLADAQRSLGQPELAVSTAELGLAVSAESGQIFYDPELRRIAALAHYDADPERVNEVITELDQSLDEARRMGAASFALETAIDLARLRRHDVQQRQVAASDLGQAVAAMGDGRHTAAQITARGLLVELRSEASV